MSVQSIRPLRSHKLLAVLAALALLFPALPVLTAPQVSTVDVQTTRQVEDSEMPDLPGLFNVTGSIIVQTGATLTIAQIVQLRIDRLHHGHVGLGIPFLGDQLPSYLSGAKAGIQAFRLEDQINLTLTVHDAADVG